ncbi:MAG: hypothetical protein E6H08_04720 [Bacteroidetes bacterium]|nr:MAG: hypothetical protein E6H08_04720 [Bacteroidota bacterium]
MKKVSIVLGFTFLLIFLSSCLTTLHPIFTEKDLAYDPKLIGTWNIEREGNKEKVTISNLATENSVELPGNISDIKEKGYLISYQHEHSENPERYIAFLARIGKYLYFDYYPAYKKEDQKIDEFFEAHLVKMHTSYRVEILNDGSFELSQLDGSYVNSLIDQKKIRISHEAGADDNIVITASTFELQQYLIKYSDEPEAYDSKKTIFKK